MKKILLSAYSLDVGGIETALITLLKYLAPKYDITLVLEKKQGIFLKEVPKNVSIITYEISEKKNKFARKFDNFIKQVRFKMKYGNKFDFSGCYATYSFPSAFVARSASKNSALWVHNNYMDFYNNDMFSYKKFFNNLKINEFKKIIFVSDMDKRIFSACMPQYSKKAIMCNNLIDYELIEEKSNEKVNDMKKSSLPTFINVGRHDEKQKRLSRIIDATRRLNKEGYKFRVIFVGKGIDTKNYEKLSKDIKNIEFLGAKKNPYPYIKKSDCVLMSSEFEGYPVVFVESKILGKPLITTDVSDSKNDIEGKYGIVVEKSENGVYKGMKRFLKDGFKVEKFNPEDFNKEIIEKLEKIIGDSKDNI